MKTEQFYTSFNTQIQPISINCTFIICSSKRRNKAELPHISFHSFIMHTKPKTPFCFAFSPSPSTSTQCSQFFGILFSAVPGAYLILLVIAPVPVNALSPVVASTVLIPFDIPLATGSSDGSDAGGYDWKYG